MKWLRLFLGVLLGAAALIAIAVIVLLGPLRPRVLAFGRPRIERVLAAVLQAPVSIRALRVTWLPLFVEADDVRIGDDGALARAQHLRVALLPRTSLRQLRPVADVTVDGATVDVPGWIALIERRPHTPARPLPPFRLRLSSHQASVRLMPEDEPFVVSADDATGELISATGRLRFSVTSPGVALSRGQRELRLQSAALSGGEAITGGWWLHAVQATGDGIDLRSNAAEGDRLPIRGRVSLPRLAVVDPVFERLGGDAELDGAIIGPLEHVGVAANVRVADLAVDGERVGDVSADAAWRGEQVRISTAKFAGAGGEADASAELAVRAPFAYQARVRWSALDVRQLARLDPSVKAIAANGRADIQGTLAPLAVQGEGNGSFTAPNGEPLNWQGKGNFRAGAVEGTVDVAQTGGNTLRAQLAVDARRAVNGSVEAVVAQPTALGAFLPIESLPNMSGSLTATAQIAGTVDDPRLNGQLAGRHLILLGVTVEQMGGSFAADRTKLQTPGITADLGQGKLALSGTFALGGAVDNDWQLRAQQVSGDTVVALVYALTGSTPPIGRGALDAEITGHGAWAGAQVTANAAMRQFWLGSEWIQQATLNGSASWPRWQIDAELRNRTDQRATLRASGRAGEDATIAAQVPGWDLTTLQRGELAESGGSLSLNASFAGPLRALSGRADVHGSNLILSGRQFEKVDLDVEATRGRWQVSTTLLDGALAVRAGVLPEPGWPFTLDGEWTEARIGRLLVPGADVWMVTSGRLHVGGRLAALQQFDASARVDSLRIVNGPYELNMPRPAQLDCRRGACTLDALELRGADTELRASATLATNGAVQLRVAGKGDLRLLELSGAIESARGPFTIDATVHRTGGAWEVAGEMAFEQTTVDVGARLAITRTSGQLALSGSTVRIVKLGGRMGTGTFEVEGTIDLRRGPDLAWTLTEVGANLAPSLEVEFSGRGTLAGSWQRMKLDGRIDVSRMLYDRDIELTDILPSLNRTLAEAPRPPSAHLVELNLHIVAPGELYVENNIARVEARADLRITGTAAAPVLDGRIEVLDGEVTFRDRKFEIEGGTADLRPDLGLAAALNITAESTIETTDSTYIVNVLVTGTTREPRVILSSDDASLTQTDLATLLAVGKTTTQLRQGGGGGFSFGQQVSTKQLLPVDRISFESTYSRTTGTFEPQLKVGKDLTDDLAVSVGQTFGVSSRTLAEATYRLTPRVYVLGSWESQTSTQEGAFAGGLKVRYEFWRVTPFTLLGGGFR